MIFEVTLNNIMIEDKSYVLRYKYRITEKMFSRKTNTFDEVFICRPPDFIL